MQKCIMWLCPTIKISTPFKSRSLSHGSNYYTRHIISYVDILHIEGENDIFVAAVTTKICNVVYMYRVLVTTWGGKLEPDHIRRKRD